MSRKTVAFRMMQKKDGTPFVSLKLDDLPPADAKCYARVSHDLARLMFTGHTEYFELKPFPLEWVRYYQEQDEMIVVVLEGTELKGHWKAQITKG